MHITVAELQHFLDSVDPTLNVLIDREDNPRLKRAAVLSEIVDGLVDAKATFLQTRGE